MDIVTHCRVPRYLHNDLPLGNPLGKPGDKKAQMASVAEALKLVERAEGPIVQESALAWSDDPAWKIAYARVDDSNRETLMKMGIENRRRRAQDKSNGLSR